MERPPPQWVGFYEVPGILLIRLMSRCNEKCLFCMVAEEIELSDDLAYADSAARIEAQPAGTLIEFFGGEPTIYPRFVDLLRVARGRGHPCSVASNVRIFHSEKFTRQVADLGASAIYIRTSLYGENSAVHDFYTATPGSFEQTGKGIRNIVAAGFACQVNIVIMRQNYDRLCRMTEMIHAWGVPRIKFGNLISVETCAAHAVPLGEVRPHLAEAIQLAERLGMRVTVEKTPVCVASGRLDLMSTESTIYGGERVYEDAGECKGCLVRRWCEGLDPGYARLFGASGLQRLDAVPPAIIRGTADSPCQPELLKTYCVEIPDQPPDEATLVRLERIREAVEAQHGLLAVFPRRFLRKAARSHAS